MRKNVIIASAAVLAVCLGIVFCILRQYALRDVDIPSPPEIKGPQTNIHIPTTAVPPVAESPVPVAARSEPRSRPRPSQDYHDFGDIAPALRVVLGLTDSADFKSRSKAIQKLGKTLERNEIEAIYRFFAANAYDQQDMSVLKLNSIKNRLLGLLLEQEKLPTDLGAQLVTMFRNEECDDVWRDYCVQHFSQYYRKRWAPDTKIERGDIERRQIRDACWEAVSHASGTISGSALLGLERLSEDYPEFDPKRVAEEAFMIASDEKTGMPSKVTAIQVAGRMGNTNVLALARECAQTTETGALRLSAIATIGYAGSSHDRDLLVSLAATQNYHLRRAASEALERLEKRLAEEKRQ